MYRRLSVFATVLLLSVFGLAEGDQQFANLGTCKVESGETIQDCRIGYRTWGTLNGEHSNVVVMLTWFTGNSGDLADFVGATKYADPAKYYIVAIDALADGVSSSPSNSVAQPRAKFPRISIADMVDTQHHVLEETLKFPHVHAILGASMGGMQAFQWAVRYPDFMDVVVPISGSTQLTPHDLLLWRAEKNAILDSKEWNDGNYHPPLHVAAVDDIHQLELETPDRLNDEIMPNNFAAEVKKIESENFDPSDRLRQLEAMMALDISKPFGGQMYAASQAVKAKMLIVVENHDHMVNPHPAMVFAEMLRISPFQLDSACGHLGASCRADLVVPRVQYALANTMN
jgi:homoserine O-acetyltransferase